MYVLSFKPVRMEYHGFVQCAALGKFEIQAGGML